MYRIAFFLICACSTICYSQKSISGYVVDSNNSPLEFANVFIQNVEANDKVYGSTTNSEGKFNILLDGNEIQKNYKIIISFIGYESWSKTITINKAIDLNKIILKQDASEIDEVVIHYKTPTITKKKDKLIFNVQNSPLKSGYDGIELLKNTPNVWVDANDNIQMRNEVATILINGRKTNMSGSNLSSYLSNLNSEAIKTIEIQTNQGANADATSTGGIINIVLKEKALGFKSQIRISSIFKGEGYYMLFPGVNANYGNEKWNLYGSFNSGFRNDFEAVTNTVFFYDENRENTSKRKLETNMKRHSFRFGVIREINEKHEIGMEIFGKLDNKNYLDYGNAFYYSENNLIDKGLNNTIGESNQNNINGVVNYSWKISPKDALKVFVDYSKSKSNDDSRVNTTYEENLYEDNLNTYESDTETIVYSVQTDYEKSLNQEIGLDFGVKYINSERDNSLVPKSFENSDFVINTSQLSDFNYQEKIFASYLSFDHTFKEKNYIKIGGRVENTDLNKLNYIDESSIKQNYTSFFPSFYFSREIAPKSTLSISYSRSLRRPSFRDLNNNIIKINDFQYVLGNGDLQPEFIDKYELSYQIKKNNFSIFYKKTNDAINGIYFLEDDIAFYKKFNSGAQVQYGVEYSTSKKIKNWWYLNFSSYLFNRKFVNEQKESSFEKATLGINFYNNFKINKTTSIDLSGRYRSPKSDAFFEASEYYSMNIAFKKSWFNNKFTLKADLRDIFNSLQYKNKRRFSDYETFTKTNLKSRFVFLKLTYNFSNNKKILKKKNKSKNDSYNRL